MRNFMYAAASIAIVMAGPALAQGKGNGNGNGHQGQGPAHAGKADHGNGQAKGKGPKMDRGPSGPGRIAQQIGNPGKGNGKADRGPANRNDIREQVRGAKRDIENGVSRRVQQARRDIRGNIDEARRDVTLRGNDVVRPRERGQEKHDQAAEDLRLHLVLSPFQQAPDADIVIRLRDDRPISHIVDPLLTTVPCDDLDTTEESASGEVIRDRLKRDPVTVTFVPRNGKCLS